MPSGPDDHLTADPAIGPLAAAEAYRRAGRLAEAVACCRAAVAARPGDVRALHLLGLLLCDSGERAEGLGVLRRAVAGVPAGDRRLGAHVRSNLAGVLWRAVGVGGEAARAEAARLLEEAVRLDAGNAAAWHNLGVVRRDAGRLAEAETALRRAVELRPGYADAHLHLGEVLRERGRLAEAEASGRRAVEIAARAGDRAGEARAWSALATTLADAGRGAEALAARRRAVELRPDLPALHSELLLALHYLHGDEPEVLFAEHLAWAARHCGERGRGWGVGGGECAAGSGVAPIALNVGRGTLDVGRSQHVARPAAERPTSNSQPPTSASQLPTPDSRPRPSNNRPLRVGYVSPDLRGHPVGRLFAPVLANHDAAAVEVFVYSDTIRPDGYTDFLRSLLPAGNWRDTAGLPHAAVADLVRRDAIDVLVDLGGHMDNGRLPMFALRPAPVQVTYLGYPDTAGLVAIDYRITDAIHDAVGETERFHTERLVRLGPCCWAYRFDDAGRAWEELPPATELPALRDGRITFAALNRPAKTTPAMVGLWGRILSAVAGSRLLVLTGARMPEGDGDANLDANADADGTLRSFYARHGVGPARVTFVGRRDREGYLALLEQCDVALDTFPYNGHTTTLDALWMGVPVVTLAGRTHVSRCGASVLSAAGCPQWVARTADEYLRVATELARDLPALAAFRRGLRTKVASSPLNDGRALAAKLEAAYRAMCEGSSGKVTVSWRHPPELRTARSVPTDSANL